MCRGIRLGQIVGDAEIEALATTRELGAIQRVPSGLPTIRMESFNAVDGGWSAQHRSLHLSCLSRKLFACGFLCASGEVKADNEGNRSLSTELSQVMIEMLMHEF